MAIMHESVGPVSLSNVPMTLHLQTSLVLPAIGTLTFDVTGAHSLLQLFIAHYGELCIVQG